MTGQLPFHAADQECWTPPGAAWCFFSGDGIETPQVMGFRDTSAYKPVEVDDLWHYGSVGKSMTTYMIASMVQKKNVSWDDQIDGSIHEARGTFYERVRLRDLLAHRSGLPTDPSRIAIARYIIFGGKIEAISNKMMRRALSTPPAFSLGDDFLYSNLGYGLAGLMISRTTGIPFEDLVQQHVIEPLNLCSLRFGMPPQDGSAPREHTKCLFSSKWAPIFHGMRTVDDIPLLRPSGCLSGTIEDLARFGRAHLLASTSEGEDHAAVRETHRPIGLPPQKGKTWRYSMGWFVDKMPDGQSILWHPGSTGGSFALLLLLPSVQRGVALVSNAFDRKWSQPESTLLLHLIHLLKTSVYPPCMRSSEA